MSRTPVYIVCSPRPQVGKTLVARLLSEFLRLQRGDVVAFDVNLKEPSLLDYLPRLTETAEVDDTFGKMALMDRLIVDDGIAKVIDLGYHAFDEFFRMIDEIGFLKEAARQVIPAEVIDRPKGYFPVPALTHLEGPYLEMVRDALYAPQAKERGLFRPDAVERLLADPNGRLTPLRGNELWQIGLLELWLQQHGIAGPAA